MPIRITSKQDGFRRCGEAHPSEPVDWPDDRFTDDELAVLKDEPMLIVEDTAKSDWPKKPAKPGKTDKASGDDK